MTSIEVLTSEAARLLAGAKRVAVLSGAGISSESGIPTFRGEGGLWENYRSEELATPQAFARDPELVWRWYDWRREVCARALPNAAHEVVAAMDACYPDFLLVTQNVDGLHARAGSERMLELHGTIWSARCTICGAGFPLPEVPLKECPVRCQICASLARPSVVWFGESYDPEVLQSAQRFLNSAEVLLVVGTSGSVGVPVYLAQDAGRNGAAIVDINPEASPIGAFANLEIPGPAGEALPQIWEKLGTGRG